MGVLYFRELRHNPQIQLGQEEIILLIQKDTLLQATMQRWQWLNTFQNANERFKKIWL